MNQIEIPTTEFVRFYNKHANDLTLLEHTAIQVYAAILSNPNYDTQNISVDPAVIAHDAIYKAQIFLRELLKEYYDPFIAARYGFDSATAPHPIENISDGSTQGEAY